MANIFNGAKFTGPSDKTFASAGGAVQDIFSGLAARDASRVKARGLDLEAGNYGLAADQAMRNADITESETRIKAGQADREAILGIGRTTADIGGAGFTLGGSALDILRDSASQAALQRGLLEEQGQVQETSYKEQAASYRQMAEYANWSAGEERSAGDKAALYGEISGGLKGVASVISLFG